MVDQRFKNKSFISPKGPVPLMVNTQFLPECPRFSSWPGVKRQEWIYLMALCLASYTEKGVGDRKKEEEGKIQFSVV